MHISALGSTLVYVRPITDPYFPVALPISCDLITILRNPTINDYFVRIRSTMKTIRSNVLTEQIRAHLKYPARKSSRLHNIQYLLDHIH